MLRPTQEQPKVEMRQQLRKRAPPLTKSLRPTKIMATQTFIHQTLLSIRYCTARTLIKNLNSELTDLKYNWEITQDRKNQRKGTVVKQTEL
jgi:hypothetical protein